MVKALEAMAQLELIISELYRICSVTWPDESEVWSAISRAEVQHAGNIEKMIALLKAKPDAFTVGRPISAVAVNTAIAGVKNNIEKLKKGELNRKQLLFILRDIERSLLESKYGGMVLTKEAGFNRLVNDIVQQTEGHQKMLEKKIYAVQEVT